MTAQDLAEAVYKPLSDAEVVLVALVLNSGAEVAAGPLEAGLAEAMNARLFGTVQAELRRRDIAPVQVGRRVLEGVI